MRRIKEISVSDLARLQADEERFELLDVRTAAEIERGVLPNAMVLPMHLVPLRLSHFSESPRQIVVYCRTGSRSAQVCRFLIQQGIYNAINLRGGIVKWAAAGHQMDNKPRQILS